MASILFASHHCYIDFASGAAAAARDVLRSLVQRGWQARVVCGSLVDSTFPGIEKLLDAHRPHLQTRRLESDHGTYSVHDLVDHNVPVCLYQPEKWSAPVELEQGYPFLQLLDEELRQRKPDVILSYGGGWMERGLIAVARRHGVPVVFWLRNTEYKSPDLFEHVGGAIVSTKFTAEYYRRTLKLNCCHVIPSLVLPERILCERREPKCVTYISPMPTKGVFYFARIASELARLRPDIPILVAIGRGQMGWFDQTGLRINGLPNLKTVMATDDPREFFCQTRLIAAPGLWEETFLRVAVEGMFNGIPTLASRRGGVIETLGHSGFLFDIPARYTPESRLVPSVAEVRPWIETIQRLFDDPQFEAEQQQKSLAEAKRFAPERIISAHEDYLRSVILTKARNLSSPSTQSLANDLDFLQKFFKTPMQLNRFAAI